ncbi:MAG TPA: glycosyltransferase [Patescibacteria group bacterium]|nr:glycosyltransferase [Patescibacteria group bacterium]
MNILIIKIGALGDVVRTSFIAQALKEKYNSNNPKIFWITSDKAKPLFINNPYIYRIIDEKNKNMVSDIFFDLIINLEEDRENCRFVSSLKSRKIIGAFLDENKKINYTPETEYWFDMSMISKYGKEQADILKKKNKKTHREILSEIIDVDYKKYEPFLRLTSYQRNFANQFLRRHSLSRKDMIIGINTGSAERWPKQLSTKKTIELINKAYKKFNSKILLFGGPSEVERNREILASSKAVVIDTGCGNNLVEFPALISLCRIFITSDSLGLHISLALKRKTICLIGPTSASEIDMYELGDKILAKSSCLCCYKNTCKSMEKISIDEIIHCVGNLSRQKVSLLITAFKEPNIGRAIEAALNQKTNHDYEIIVSAPDFETKEIVRKYMEKNKNIKFFDDPGKGKSLAINLVFSKIETDILILTDGDVYISENCVEDIVNAFYDTEIGCLSGRPVPQETKTNKYGYWANFLFDAAHRIRKKAFETNSFIECSGYLFAFRKKHIKKIPLDVAEDTIIPYIFWGKGYKIGYIETAKVYVKNADNIKDWIMQKIRTHKSHGNLVKYVDIFTTPKVKSFKTEAKGIFFLFRYPSSYKEIIWSAELASARFYSWIKYFLDTHIFDRHYTDGWKRIESTK